MLTFLVAAAALAVLFVALIYVESRYKSDLVDAGTLIAPLARLLRRPFETLDGYEQPELIEVIFQKTQAYHPEGDWPEMLGASTVLDFGGGCGLHYKQAKVPGVRWAVVETPAMVERAKELATANLQFFSNISDARQWLGDVDIMYSNGALQYAMDPVIKLKQLCGVHAKKMLWYRVSLSAHSTEREIQSSRLSNNGPGKLHVEDKFVKYARTKIPEHDFLVAHSDYALIERGPDWFRFELKSL